MRETGIPTQAEDISINFECKKVGTSVIDVVLDLQTKERVKSTFYSY